MASRKRTKLLQSSDEFFHVYNRGVNYERLFCCDFDYESFLELMKSAFDPSLIAMHAYSLMPNHFHFILQQLKPRALSLYMKEISEKFAKAVNKRRNRRGHLFQGRYDMKHVDNRSYLLALSRYIHLNPVHAHLVEEPEEWRFGSAGAYRNGNGRGFVSTNVILSQAGGAEPYWNYLHGDSPMCGDELSKYLIDRELL